MRCYFGAGAAHERLGIALERIELVAFLEDAVHERGLDLRIVRHGRDAPGLGAVAQETLRQEDDRGHVLQGYLRGIEGRIEAVRGRMRGHDRDRAFAVATVEGLGEVGLLGLGREAGRRAAALDVDDDQRQLGHERPAL